MKTIHLLTVAAVLVLSLGASACGSGSSTSTAGTTAQQEAPAPAPSAGSQKAGSGSKGAGSGSGPAAGSPTQSGEPSSEPHFTPHHHHDSAGGSKQFVQKGGDNSVQKYGSEDSGSEFNEAATALHTYLDARAAGAWGAACDALAHAMVEQLVGQLGGATGGKSTCAEVLASFDSGIPAAARREGAEANVAALRTKGNIGFLLFKGPRNEPFFIPMRREDGHWKVGAVGPSPLP